MSFRAPRTILIFLILNYQILTGQAFGLDVPAEQESSYQAALIDVGDYTNLLRDMKASLDRSQFDTDTLAEKLEFDLDTILEFVESNIGFEQYEGLLRGAEGTLITHAGNSLDQSVLLATLLRDAGFDARIANTRISSLDAAKLIEQISANDRLHSSIGDEAKIESVILSRAAALGMSGQDFNKAYESSFQAAKSDHSVLLNRYSAEKKYLVDALVGADVAPKKDPGLVDLIEEARDYYWVQHRRGPSEPWVGAHPAWKDNTKPSNFKPERVFVENVPPELLHRVRFEAYIEQDIAGELRRHTIVPAWERPAANLSKVPITFSITSRALLQQSNSDAALDPDFSNDLFIPQFSQTSPTVAFDSSGNVVPVDAALSAYSGIFRTTADKTNKAVSAIIGLGGKDSAELNKKDIRLRSVKVAYTTISPSGIESTHTRVVYDSERVDDWVSAHFSQNLDEPYRDYAMITRVFTIAVTTGKVNQSFALNEQLDQALAKIPLVEAMIALEHSAELSSLLSETAASTSSLSWLNSPQLSQTFSQHPAQRREKFTYQHAPGITVHHRTLPFGVSTIEGIDIVTHTQRGFEIGAGGLASSPDAVLSSGVWATIVEGTLLDDSGAKKLDTSSSLSEARRQGIGLTIITPGQESEVLKLGLDQFTQALIVEDLHQGYVVAVPQTSAKSKLENGAWWRVNTSTGDVLGMTNFGEGSVVTEYMIKGFVTGAVAGGAACLGVAVMTGGIKRIGAKAWTCTGFAVASGCYTAVWAAAPVAAIYGAPKIGGFCYATVAILTLGFNVPNIGQ